MLALFDCPNDAEYDVRASRDMNSVNRRCVITAGRSGPEVAKHDSCPIILNGHLNSWNI